MIKHWEEKTLKPWLAKNPERKEKFTTLSDKTIERLYTSESLVPSPSIPLPQGEREVLEGAPSSKSLSLEGRGIKGEGEAVGFPGEFPFTRGVYPTMHRGRLWTMRQFAGFGTAEDTNQRFKYLLKEGQTGLSTAFHFPTLMGYDSNSPRAKGEVGVCGVAIDSLKDMETLFSGIPLEKVTVSMTINGPACILLAYYLACAEKQGCDFKKLGGTIQNDVLKEYIAQNSYLVPPEAGMRIVADMIEYCTHHVPKWNPVSISGYHIREAGSTAAQELAFTLADGLAYVEECVKRGLDVNQFAPRLSFFFNSHIDFFEEIAKFRAARRLWAKMMKERYNPTNPDALKCRFHVQTAGCSLTAQQPENNIIRTTLEALAAVLGGCQSLHTNSMDETLSLPTEKAVRIALRTQQILAHEAEVTNTIDPLGGSYFIEKLTDELEEEALNYIKKIDEMGGMVEAIKKGFPQLEIAASSLKYQKQVENKEKIIVGVNDFTMEENEKPEVLKIDSFEIEKKQKQILEATKKERNNDKVSRDLKKLEEATKTSQNLMPYLLDCARSYCTVEEISTVLRKSFGEYHDPGIF